jgi:hypothetical protein
MAGKNMHVRFRASRWLVTKDFGARATAICDTKKEAVRIAREQAQKERSELFVYKEDDKLETHTSYAKKPKKATAAPKASAPKVTPKKTAAKKKKKATSKKK